MMNAIRESESTLAALYNGYPFKLGDSVASVDIKGGQLYLFDVPKRDAGAVVMVYDPERENEISFESAVAELQAIEDSPVLGACLTSLAAIAAQKDRLSWWTGKLIKDALAALLNDSVNAPYHTKIAAQGLFNDKRIGE